MSNEPYPSRQLDPHVAQQLQQFRNELNQVVQQNQFTGTRAPVPLPENVVKINATMQDGILHEFCDHIQNDDLAVIQVQVGDKRIVHLCADCTSQLYGLLALYVFRNKGI